MSKIKRIFSILNVVAKVAIIASLLDGAFEAVRWVLRHNGTFSIGFLLTLFYVAVKI